MCVVRVFGTLILINSALFGQTIAPPKYEVSSIKPDADSDLRNAFRIEPDGTLYATGITLRRLMMTAYNVPGFRLIGGPGWVSAKRWDVQAKPSRAALGTKEIRPMLRALLEDRFQLQVHSETRNMPIYELTVGPKGPKLHRVEDGKTKLDIRTGNGLIRFSKATVAMVTAAHPSAYEMALRCLRRGGTLAVVGMANEPFKISAVSMVSGETRIVASAVGTRQDLRELFDLVEKHAIRCTIETRPLDQVTHVFDKLKRGEVRGRVVLTM